MPKEIELEKEILAELHAMQSAVATYLLIDPSPGSPKHLRVGLNSSMADHGALTALLIEKGLFTIEEYQESRLAYAKAEAKAAANRARKLTGNPNLTFS